MTDDLRDAPGRSGVPATPPGPPDDPNLTDPAIAPSWSANGMSLPRLMALSDGVFAIAITILAVNIRPPDLGDDPTEADLRRALWRLWPEYVSYALSFVVIGVYWIGHHNIFHQVRRSDRTLLWLNLLYLLCVSFVPFPAHLLGLYGDHPAAAYLYGANLVAAGGALLGLWVYVQRADLVIPSARPRLWPGVIYILAIPAVSAASMVVAAWSPRVSVAIYAAIPLLYFMPSRLDEGWKRISRGDYDRKIAEYRAAHAASDGGDLDGKPRGDPSGVRRRAV